MMFSKLKGLKLIREWEIAGQEVKRWTSKLQRIKPVIRVKKGVTWCRGEEQDTRTGSQSQTRPKAQALQRENPDISPTGCALLTCTLT